MLMGSVKYYCDLNVAIILGTSLKYRQNEVMERAWNAPVSLCVCILRVYPGMSIFMSASNCLMPLLIATQAKTVETVFELLRPHSLKLGRSGETALLVGFRQRV